LKHTFFNFPATFLDPQQQPNCVLNYLFTIVHSVAAHIVQYSLKNFPSMRQGQFKVTDPQSIAISYHEK